MQIAVPRWGFTLKICNVKSRPKESPKIRCVFFRDANLAGSWSSLVSISAESLPASFRPKTKKLHQKQNDDFPKNYQKKTNTWTELEHSPTDADEKKLLKKKLRPIIGLYFV